MVRVAVAARTETAFERPEGASIEVPLSFEGKDKAEVSVPLPEVLFAAGLLRGFDRAVAALPLRVAMLAALGMVVVILKTLIRSK